MWNDTDLPLGYLITFRCRGTWLHGDERGSTDRHHHVYGAPHLAPNPPWQQFNTRTLKSDPVTLTAGQRESVERAVAETCQYRRWRLHALAARTNHVHVVVSIGETKPERALNALKANATRQMKEDGNWRESFSPWSDKGSQRYLWNERSLALALDYVVNGQGGPLPDFD
jgi:REP element-mobilizing transposase RayT